MAQTTGGVELWGGVECTRNRVGDTYHDQLTRSGHDRRLDDLDRFASLGLRALRYPLLWERMAPNGVQDVAWDWADQRMARLQYLGLRPIVGLVHHGSGPPDTSLVAADFAPRLAEYAGAVARRYPWVDAYTPVNEPLTTARFCGLYGHWYPHARDDATFVRALLNQCQATVLAMQAIRQVNPAAKLVQTDDLGKVHSTRVLAYQADFENERRWLAWDLLCGRVDERHRLAGYLRENGATPRELAWFRRHRCPPDVIGVNYYITSERYLDQRVMNYPPETHGGNGQVAYADVAAVRVLPGGPVGLGVLLREAWRRYARPLAVTECHLGCTREEQMRWLWEVWQTAQRVRASGVDVRAVTVWSLLGAFDWASLLTCCAGEYESGAFDVRSPEPRETAIGRLARALAKGSPINEPVLLSEGWWHRPQRLLFGPPAVGNRKPRPARKKPVPAQPVLITGAAGTLGAACSRVARKRGLSIAALQRAELDITDRTAVGDVLDAVRPWAVVNAAEYVRVDAAEGNPDECRRVNAGGAAIVAEECHRRGVRLLAVSSDLVFDGRKNEPYIETDQAAPLSVYGRSKADAEREIAGRCPDALVVRSGAHFGPWDQYNFASVTLRALAAGRRVPVAADVRVSPTYVPDLVEAMLDLLIDGAAGVWHLANESIMSWAEFARRVARLAGVPEERVCGVPAQTLNWQAPRPACSALGSVRGRPLPSADQALERWFAECAVAVDNREERAGALPA